MSILARIHAHGGQIVRSEWRFTLKPGRLTPDALSWLKKHWRAACAEAWPALDLWEERAAIREYMGGQSRAEAEASAYAEVAGC